MGNKSPISIFGLGKLGIPMAACFAHKGFRVIGVDVDAQKVDLLNRGVTPIFEPGLEELLRASQGRLVATQDHERAVMESAVTFLVTPTPSDERDGFSLEYVLSACESLGATMARKGDFHLVVLVSTVLPGATGGEVGPLLERRSGKRCGEGFGLCYSPEFIALGSVIHDFLKPNFVLIGESDPFSGALLASLYQELCDNSPPVARMSFVNAELAKLAVNTFVTTKITFANMLARICEQLPGGNVDAVTRALGLDRRIGPHYLKGAIGYGGPCFPRDNAALACLARQLGVAATLAETTDAANRQQVGYLARLIESKLPEGGRIGILGLSYKPDTDVVEESQGLLLTQQLAQAGLPVVVYDPAALENARRVLGSTVLFASTAESCIHQADVIVLATPWEAFKGLDPSVFRYNHRRPILIDCWRLLEEHRYQGIADYVSLGRGPQGAEIAAAQMV